jgi:hypothetical protein
MINQKMNYVKRVLIVYILYFIIIVTPLSISSIIIPFGPFWGNSCSNNIVGWLSLNLGQYVLGYGLGNILFALNLLVPMIILLHRYYVARNTAYMFIGVLLNIIYNIIWAIFGGIIFYNYYINCFLKGEPLAVLAFIDWIVSILQNIPLFLLLRFISQINLEILNY